MRLIDADALKERKFVGVATWHPVEVDSWQQGWNDAIDTIIEAVPTIEAVPVVRCKDCIYWGTHFQTKDGKRGDCMNSSGAGTSAEHFCAYGERRTK